MNNQNDEALKRKVLVSRLNGWVSRYSLRNKFKRFGRIRDIKFDPAFATIEFTKQSHAVAAEMFMNGSYLDEQRVKVRALGFVRVPPPPSIFPGILQDHGPSQNGKRSVCVCVYYFLLIADFCF